MWQFWIECCYKILIINFLCKKKIFLFALLYFSPFAQIENFEPYENDNILGWIIPKSKGEKITLVSNLLKRKEFYEIAKFSETLKEFYDFFKIGDFNKDGINDVLYEGY